jgi:hypothetical protein
MEAINLGNFVFDSDDLSTVRRDGLTLLYAPRFLNGQVDLFPGDFPVNQAFPPIGLL